MAILPGAGAVVIYHGKPAVVTETGKDKITISTAQGVKSVRPKDVEFLHRGPVRSLPLPEPSCCADQAELAELMGGETLPFSEFTQLAFGSDTPANAVAALALLEEALYFSGSISAGVTANPAEFVAEKQAKLREKTDAAAARAQLLERVARGEALPEDFPALREVEQVAESRSANSSLMKDIQWGRTPENAHKLLIFNKVWPETHNPFPARFELLSDSEIVRPALPELPPAERVDYTHLESAAIDDAFSNDPDDAIGYDLEKDLLLVHVADVSALLDWESEAVAQAVTLGCNSYLPDGVSHMLAPELTGRLALLAGAKVPAMTFVLKPEADGNLSLVQFHHSFIRVDNYNYETAHEELLDKPYFRRAEEVLDRFRLFRKEHNALFIDLPEVKIRLAGETVEILPVTLNPMRQTVANAMIACGAALGNYAAAQGWTMPYSSQQPPEEAIDADATTIPGIFALRRSCRPGVVTGDPRIHYGLGVAAYIRCTSPLRRCEDLLAHCLLDRVLRGEDLPLGSVLEERLAVAADASAMRRKLERRSNEYYTLLYLKQHPEWEGAMILVDRQDDRFTFLIPELAYEYKCRLRSRMTLGTEVSGRLQCADPPSLSVHFAIPGAQSSR
ncbi:MAG: RNB domain-containing ribonuclease [Victivallaceae bacterium]|nr:RNB domain-containing ribonuclease [Victivallaceae bacterium]